MLGLMTEVASEGVTLALDDPSLLQEVGETLVAAPEVTSKEEKIQDRQGILDLETTTQVEAHVTVTAVEERAGTEAKSQMHY